MNPYRVMIVDDSAFVRKVVRELLRDHPMFEVVGAAGDGREAEAMIERLRPDIVTCDLTMPRVGGVAFVKQQMAKRALPIVMMSSQQPDAEDALAALEAGAIAFVRKPTALATERMYEVRAELDRALREAASSVPKLLAPSVRPPLSTRSAGVTDILVIGVSTGGPQALRHLLPRLPAQFPVPIAVVLHMPVGYTALFARNLDEICALQVREASDGEPMRAGRALIARAGCHMLLERAGDEVRAKLSLAPFDSLHRPAVDVLFRSAAECYGARTLALVMTGMGSDGKVGAAWVKAKGGVVLTEAQSSCVVYGMPRAVDEAGLSDASIELEQIPCAIGDFI